MLLWDVFPELQFFFPPKNRRSFDSGSLTEDSVLKRFLSPQESSNFFSFSDHEDSRLYATAGGPETLPCFFFFFRSFSPLMLGLSAELRPPYDALILLQCKVTSEG